MSAPRRVHMPSGFTPASGGKSRACCSCGYRTTPRTTRKRAAEALASEHGETKSDCDVCGREHFEQGGDWSRRFANLRIIVDDVSGDQLLVCADDERGCMDRSARRQVQLDRAAFGESTPRPRLRVLPGGAR